MDTIDSQIRQDAPEFRENHTRMTLLVAELRERLATARLGGGERYLQRHREQGKLPVRERIDRLPAGRRSKGAGASSAAGEAARPRTR